MHIIFAFIGALFYCSFKYNESDESAKFNQTDHFILGTENCECIIIGTGAYFWARLIIFVNLADLFDNETHLLQALICQLNQVCAKTRKYQLISCRVN